MSASRFLSVLTFFVVAHFGIAQILNDDIIVLQPTGSEIDSLTEMTILADTTDLYQSAKSVIENTYIKEAVTLHKLVQQFLVNNGQLEQVEPAYLALTQNQGGYARKGFALNVNGIITKKPKSFYVDIVEGNVRATPAKLMSVTQLYPHELGHILYRLLSSSDTIEETSRSVNVHFFSIITDYQIAFNEGFAEHFENVARLYEPNDSIRAGIFSDITEKEKRFEPYIRGFEKDHRWSIRMDYYKATMIAWYQQFEDYKRYKYAMEDLAAFKNKTVSSGSHEDRISFRNSGVRRSQEKRNMVQSLSSEGVVSGFFTGLIQSGLPDRYRTSSFYKRFLSDTSTFINPSERFSPVQNQMMKIFYVLNKHVIFEYSERSQLTDFIDGYCLEFPDEANSMKFLFKRVTGLEFSDRLPPQIWLLVKKYDHRLIILDQFDGLTIPVYSFNLNAAETEELMTLGLSTEKAHAVIEYRDTYGYFQNLSEVRNVPGLTSTEADMIISHNFDQEYFDALAEPELKIRALIVTPLLHLLKEGLFWFAIIIILRYLIFYKTLRSVHHIRMITAHLSHWLLLLVIGLIAVAASPKPIFIFLPVSILLATPGALIYRKNVPKLKRHTTVVLLMTVAIALSLI